MGSAARSIRVFSPTAIIELGSIWWVIRAQLIIPDLVVVTATYKEGRVETARCGRIGSRVICLLASLAYL